METIRTDCLSEQSVFDVTTIIKNVGTGSPDSRSRIEEVVSAILNNLSLSLPSDDSNLLSSLRTLQLLLQVCVNSDLTGNEFSSELAVKALEISSMFLERSVKNFDATALTLCNIITLSLVLMPMTDLLMNASAVISKCEEELSVFLTSEIQHFNNFDPQIAVQLLCSSLSALGIRHVCDNPKLSDLFHKHTGITHDLIAKLCLCKNDAVRSQVLIILVPKILKQEKRNKILEKLFHMIAKSEGEESLNRALAALTALCAYYLPGDGNDVTFSVEGIDAFWYLVQKGLCSDCALSRKHALFLIRRCISSLVSTQKEVRCNMFFWDPNCSKDFSWWQDICTVLEVLEERASHLVSPVLCTLENILRNICKEWTPTIYLTWCLNVFRRVLQHPCIHVVKWGVVTLISDLGCNLICSKDARIFHQFFLHTLIYSLNSPQIYYEIGDEFEHNEEVTELEYLEKYFVSAAKSEMRKEIFVTLFDVMGSFNWAPIPLFIFTKSLMKVPSFKCLDPAEIPILKRLVGKVLATQNISIRSVCLQHLLFTTINLTNNDNLDLKAVLDLLTAFYIDGNLIRNSELWNDLVAWMSKAFKENVAVSWIRRPLLSFNYFPPALAQLILLLYDANVLKNLISLESLFNDLSDCDTRLYIDQEAQTRCVEFVAHLLRVSYIAKVCDKLPIDRTRDDVLCAVKATANNILLLLKQSLLCVPNVAAFQKASRLFKCFEYFCHDPVAAIMISGEKAFVRLVSASFDIVENDLLEKKVNFVFAMKVIKSCCENEELVSSIQLTDRRGNFLMKILQSNVLVEAPFAPTSKLLQWSAELLGPLSSSVLEVQWEFVSLSISESLSDSTAKSLLEAIAVGLDLGSRNLLPILLKILRKVIAKFPKLDTSPAVLRHCWASILEIRHKDIFYSVLRELLSAILQPDFVQTQQGEHFVSECGHELLSWGETALNVVAEFAFALNILIHKSPKVLLQNSIRSFLVSCFVIHTIQRRDEKLLRKITSSITHSNSSAPSQLLRDDPFASVRCTAVEIFLFVISREGTLATEIADLLVEDLLKQTETPEAKRLRYFSNSSTHRIHLHVLQGLLLVEPKTSHGKRSDVGKWIMRRLLSENHQLSVRYLSEWLLVRILASDVGFRTDLLDLVQSGDIRESALCSVICTLLHYSQSLQVEENRAEHVRKFLSEFFEALLPLTMSQAYGVRFNAHVAILRVWGTLEKLQLEQEIDLYKVSALAVQKSFTRASNKFQNHKDFYLTELNCVEHYTLETLFYDIPRLTLMSKDEWLEIHHLKTRSITKASRVPLINKDSRLRDFIPTVNRRSETSNVAAQSSCVQKKMVPSKWLEINELQVKSLPEVLRPWTKEEDFPGRGLVVVASLLDKASNLGGLARTCEIMGVSLVLPKMSFVSDREFQALSMSSEMWAPLSEVKPHKLAEFLTEMKERGFKLVGAEQTAKSTPLNSVQFDEKTVLLLGNEVEGIPSNFLPLLDVCVEIPQFGLVRSLNVHVAGALFVYEYRRQHSNVT